MNGGSITLSTTVLDSHVDLAAGSLIDVSGGGSVSASGKIAGGNGGALAITAASGSSDDTSTLAMAGELRGYSLVKGASLSITTSTATVGSPNDGVGSYSAGFSSRAGSRAIA